MKYYIKNLENKNEIISHIIDIIETIINHIHISKYNLENFYDIIIPLTSALSSIRDELSKEEKYSLFNNNIINILYLYVITSHLPKASKNIFKEVVGISNDILIPDIDYNDDIFKKNLSKINNLDWYCFILFAHFEINVLIYNDVNNAVKIICEQFSKIILTISNDTNKYDDFQNNKYPTFCWINK